MFVIVLLNFLYIQSFLNFIRFCFSGFHIWIGSLSRISACHRNLYIFLLYFVSLICLYFRRFELIPSIFMKQQIFLFQKNINVLIFFKQPIIFFAKIMFRVVLLLDFKCLSIDTLTRTYFYCIFMKSKHPSQYRHIFKCAQISF